MLVRAIVIALCAGQAVAYRLPTLPSHRPVAARANSPAMGLQVDLSARMKAAMKSGDKETLSTLRMVVAAMQTKQKEGGDAELSDADALAVLAKLAKMRKESIDMFEQGGKQAAADKEKAELELIEAYLPSMADEATVKGWIGEAIAAVCPDGPDKSQMGKVMGSLMASHKGQFDGKAASKWVAEALRS